MTMTLHMALRPKDTAVQFRLDADSLQSFKARCDYHGVTVSQALREAIRFMNVHHEKEMAARALKLQGVKKEPTRN